MTTTNGGDRVRFVVVCHANVTRSVAAAYLLTSPDVEVRSAGTHVLEGQRVSERTRRALEFAIGKPVDLSAHRAHELNDADAEWADLILAMEGQQVRLLRRRHPSSSARIATLGYLARRLPADSRPLAERLTSLQLDEVEPADSDDVVDPAGGDDDAYEATMRDLVDRCRELLERLQRPRS
jgi:protein-tyrosine phosphatase